MRNLRTIRKTRGYSVAGAARAISAVTCKEVSDASWTRWEGLRSDPTPEARNAIADLFGVTLDQLAGRQPFDTPAFVG